ncbi:MAG: FHA domain-containing protein [Thermoanaerobaculia bacterium]
MPEKRCENGHVIDASWDLCPYCPPEKKRSEIAIVRPGKPVAHVESAASSPQVQPVSRPVAAPSPPPPQRTIAVAKADLGIDPEMPRYVVGWLIGLNGSARGESYSVRIGRNVIGRDRRSDIFVADELASAHHADLVFRPDEKRFILMDHNSTNGTFVNDLEIEPRRDLASRDIVRIGSQKFLFLALCDGSFCWEDQDAVK